MYYGAPTTGARNWSRLLASTAAQERGRGDQFLGAALWEKRRKREAVLKAMENFASELHKREAEKAAKKKKGGWFGAGGAGAGAAIGALLAIPTGGLSIAAGAALGGSIGGGVGSAIDTATGGSGEAGQQISSTMGTAMGQFENWQNPWFQGGGDSVSQYVPGPAGGYMADEPYGFASGYH